MLLKYYLPMIVTDNKLIGSVKKRDKVRFVYMLKVMRVFSLFFFVASVFITLLGTVYLFITKEYINNVIIMWMSLPLGLNLHVGCKEAISIIACISTPSAHGGGAWKLV